jgi:hypothetical protein
MGDRLPPGSPPIPRQQKISAGQSPACKKRNCQAKNKQEKALPVDRYCFKAVVPVHICP